MDRDRESVIAEVRATLSDPVPPGMCPRRANTITTRAAALIVEFDELVSSGAGAGDISALLIDLYA